MEIGNDIFLETKYLLKVMFNHLSAFMVAWDFPPRWLQDFPLPWAEDLKCEQCHSQPSLQLGQGDGISKGMSLAREDLLPQLVGVQESGKTNWSANLPLCKKLSSSPAAGIRASKLGRVAHCRGRPSERPLPILWPFLLLLLKTAQVAYSLTALHNKVAINYRHTCMNMPCILFLLFETWSL